jgi:cytochrome c-type biogenesis protein
LSGSTIGVIAAFAAGVLSFFSPCVLPLVPGYLSFLAAHAGAHTEGPGDRSRLLLQALAFVAGFSLVFIAFGATASALGSLLRDYREVLSRLAGVLIIAFGIVMLGVFRFPWLYGDVRFDPAGSARTGRWTGFVMGVLFAFGWTPCVGPILGSILVLAGSTASLSRGVLLLAVYSAGLAAPFLAAALLLDRVTVVSRWLARHSLTVQRVGGALLIVLGLAMATGTLSVGTAWLLRLFGA